MAGIIHGRVTSSSIPIDAGVLGSETVRFTTLPTSIKYLLLEVPSENKGDVYVGGSTVANNNAPLLAKGTPREFTFRHDVKEAPGDLSDFYANFGHSGDVINYLAITI
jgi:subtilase family serine protease|tara:strand:- start:75 stop:398 length:324 start_codon:yes stop_codon:yes gene_type:complete